MGSSSGSGKVRAQNAKQTAANLLIEEENKARLVDIEERIAQQKATSLSRTEVYKQNLLNIQEAPDKEYDDKLKLQKQRINLFTDFELKEIQRRTGKRPEGAITGKARQEILNKLKDIK